ncbi:MAG TPA: amidohydrolase family protein [Gemmatimonadaceae bacterium]|nr:amidohydrolase family protein [Gemmatimonadaceae bacterium]
MSPREVAPDHPAGDVPLIDVHAHFWHPGTGRADWEAPNRARLRAGARIGISCHIGSILGSFGHTSPTYLPSPADVTTGNDAMLAIAEGEGSLVRAYVAVNPNDGRHALDEIERCVARGAIGIKLAASRRADHPLLDPIAELAADHGLPVLHHIWQHRRQEWPGQEASDGVELARLAGRHPRVWFILAHIGGGGDYRHTFAAAGDVPNILFDLSGSGVDRGMLDDAVASVGTERLVWGSDITMETGLAKLLALEELGLPPAGLEDVRWRTAARVFPPGSFARLGGGVRKARTA